MGEKPFVRECRKALRNLPGSNDISQSRKELYRKLVVGSQWAARLYGEGGPLPLELGAKFGLFEQFRVLAHLVACTERIAPSQLELQSRPGRHAWLRSLLQWLGRNGWARLLLQRVGSRRRVDGSHWTQIARAARRWLRRGQRFASVSGWEACGVSHDPSCNQNGDLDDAKEGIVWRCKLSYCDFILFFRHQLRDKIRCDRKRLDHITFNKRWVNAASLVVRKEAMLESSFPPLPVHDVYSPGPSTPSRVGRFFGLQP